MTTIADRLAVALREAMEWNWIECEDQPATVVQNCEEALSAYEAQKADPCSTAEHWRKAMEEYVTLSLGGRAGMVTIGLDWVERRVKELAKQP